MRRLLEEHGMMIITIIAAAAILYIFVSRITGIQDMKRTNDEQVLNFSEREVNAYKAPIFSNMPTKERVEDISNGITHNWDYFMSGITVTDYKKNTINDNVKIRVYKLYSDEDVKDLGMKTNTVYLGVLEKNNISTESMYTLDKYDLDYSGNVYSGNNQENIAVLSYKSYIDKGFNTDYSSKYKLIYQVTDDAGYKAEYEVLCIMENKDILTSTNIVFSIPPVASVYDNIHDLKEAYISITTNIKATLSNMNNEIIRNCTISYSSKIVNMNTLSETSFISVNDLDTITESSYIQIKITAADEASGKTAEKTVTLPYTCR